MTTSKNSRIGKWWQEYTGNPLDALDRLLCRRFYMGILNRNETAEILFHLFHNKSNKTIRQLDDVMKQWFASHWGKIPGSISTSRWATILQNAFIPVYRLNLDKTALFLRDIYTREKSWLRSLYLAPSRDPEGWLLRTLALCQKTQILLPLWMRLCRWEEDLPIHYTSIALLGLRKLPDKDGSPHGDLPTAVFKGIIVLAEALGKRKRQQCKEHWLREVRTIAALYPRSKHYWALHFFPFIYHQPESLPAQWLNKAIPKLDDYLRPKSAAYIQPPPYEKRTHFLNLIKNHPLEKFYEDLKIFLNEHRKYAYQTGDSSFLVKMFSDIGYRIFKQDTSLALELVEEAFAWAPYNPFLWSQRSIIEAYRGNGPQAAAILWEAKRRFPENPQIRAKLAHLMEKQGKYKTAESLYRQAIVDPTQNETNRKDDFDPQLLGQDAKILYEPYDKDKALIEKIPGKGGASLIRGKVPGEYGKPSSPSPDFIWTEINEVEIEIGEITLLFWESRRADAKEREQYKQQISEAVEELLKKVPGNISALLLKGLWFSDYKANEAEGFLLKQMESHPNIMGFRLLELRTKSLKDMILDKCQWNDLIRDFPSRSTIIKLEYILCFLNNPRSLSNNPLKELEKLRKQFKEEIGRLPTTLQKNEEWVKNTIKNRLFKSIDPNKPLTPQSLDTIKENFKENELVLRETVDHCIFAAV
jgi:tetratricopeptide (TPR) repeat protein